MSTLSDAGLLLNYSRAFFKGSYKTSNKRLANAGTASWLRSSIRNHKIPKAEAVLEQLHPTGHLNIDHIYMQLSSMDQNRRAGNCDEYMSIALVHGIHRKIPNMWMASHFKHHFLVLANALALEKTLLSDFGKFSESGFYCCDPWLNIACEMQDYHQKSVTQCGKWGVEGKEVGFGGNWISATMLPSLLLYGHIHFKKFTDENGIRIV